MLFKDQPIGQNILGTPDSVGKLNINDIKDFISHNYNTGEMVFAIMGDYDFSKVIKLSEKYLASIPLNNPVKNRVVPVKNKLSKEVLLKPISQTHCIIGNQAYANNHKYKNGLLLLNNLLGGFGMSSRLNLEIREKYGICLLYTSPSPRDS